MFEGVDLWGLAFSDDGHSVFASVSTGAQAFSFKFTALRACKLMTVTASQLVKIFMLSQFLVGVFFLKNS